MCEPENAAVFETLLRLSLIEGFTVDHLRPLGSGTASAVSGPGVRAPRRNRLPARVERALASPEADRSVERVRETCRRSGIAIVSWLSPEYPEMLREIPAAPLVLYRAGAAWNGGTAVAVVGSRSPTGPGREFARILAEDLSAAGFAVVSGMARGIDGAAHRGAMRAGGRTVAVLGCGVDVTYPPEHAQLREEIVQRGALYSEYPPGSLPLARRFPARNRIVSGLCRGVIVAEAAERSGALITARLALDQGREVMAVPGNPYFAHTAGSNRLLREGAVPACCVADVIGAVGNPAARNEGTAAGRVLGLLSRERHVGEIAASLSVRLPELLPMLTDLELANLVVKSPGDYYKRKL